MKPYYSDDQVTLFHGDCHELIPSLGVVDLVVADPPYNIGKADWDWIDDYRTWSQAWIDAASQRVTAHGGFWCFHSEPLILADLARMIESAGRRMVNFITLDKTAWSIAKRYANAGTKTFPAAAEYVTYSRREVYPDEIAAIRREHGLTRAQFDTLIAPSQKGTGLCYRWEHGERIPQSAEVEAIRERFGVTLTLPVFHNPAKATSVWRFPLVEPNGHPTPKPLGLVTRIVEATSEYGALVLDPFAGSGTTLRAAKDCGRRAIGIELDERYCEIAARRLAQDALPFGVAS